MKRSAVAICFMLFICLALSSEQVRKVRISLTASSNVSASEIGKTLDKRCPEVLVTVDSHKADYVLEAIDTEKGSNPYKFTLFDSAGDRVFSTETLLAGSAVKGVCGYIRKHSGSQTPGN